MKKVVFPALGMMLVVAWMGFYGWSVADSKSVSSSDWHLILPAATSRSTHQIKIDFTSSDDSQVQDGVETPFVASANFNLLPNNTPPVNRAVTSDGTILFVQEFRQVRNSRFRPQLVSLRFDESGETIQGCVCLGNSWWHDRRRDSVSEAAIMPRVAADPGSKRFRGHVYCVWTDGNRDAKQQVFIAVSADHGKSWSRPVILSNGQKSRNFSVAAMPSIAVNDQGVVGVSWYERHDPLVENARQAANQPSPNVWELRFRASLDGGETWLANSLVDKNSSLCNIDINHAQGLRITPEGGFQTILVSRNRGTSQLQTASYEIKIVK